MPRRVNCIGIVIGVLVAAGATGADLKDPADDARELLEVGRPEEALVQALAAEQQAQETQVGPAGMAEIKDLLGDALYANSRPEDALEAYQAGLELRRSLPSGRRHLSALSLHKMAKMYSALGDWDQARVLLEEGLRVCAEHNGKDSPCYAESLMNYATYFSALGDNTNARQVFMDALEILEGHPDEPQLTDVLLRLSSVELALGNLEASESYRRRAAARE